MKSHAVTMFEVGKLSDESLDSFLSELEKVFNSTDNVHLSRIMRKPAFRTCICKIKGTDQLWGNPTADQRLCVRHIDSTIPILSKTEISSF